MRRRERNVAKERFRLIAVDKIERSIGAHIDDIAVSANHAAILFERRVEVFTPMPRCVAEVFSEPTRHRVIRPLTAIVPFAKCACRVPRSTERLGNRSFTKVEAFLSRRDAMDAAARMISSGQKFRACRRTDWAHEEPIESRAISRNRVDV